jgi:DNA polymerase III subunit gamma/tau
MEYIAFALKYRPRNLDEVVGQAHVVSSLRNAIITKRVHHAYLFSGPRGVGKTSLARILAKSLNCEKGSTPKPCDKCNSCVSIAKGNSLDILEIDGASNRGIDEIRTLRENVKLSSAGSRFKIYIIDEVHMLTQEAFNALLKTLEEPPSHVKFIFATTHPHKVLPTILSRCQKFQFNLLNLEDIVAKLKRITKAENLQIQESLLYTIGRASGGSVRDAESLLDQLVPMLLEKGSLDDVFSFLGIIDEDSLNNLLTNLINKDLPATLDFIDSLASEGKDLGMLLTAIIEHVRNLLLAKVSPKTFTDLSEVSPQSKKCVIDLSKKITSAEVLKLIDLLLDAKTISARLNTVRVPFELALIKFAYADFKEAPIIKDIKKAPQEIPQNIKKNPKKEEMPVVLAEPVGDFDLDMDDFGAGEGSVSPLPVKDGSKEQGKQPVEAELIEDQTQEEDNSGVNDDIVFLPVKTKWLDIIKEMQKSRVGLASHISFSLPISSRGSLVIIAFSPEDHFHKEIVEVSKNLMFIESVISSVVGKKIGIKFVLHKLPKGAVNKTVMMEKRPNNQGTSAGNQTTAGQEDGYLNEILDTFGGQFHSEG